MNNLIMIGDRVINLSNVTEIIYDDDAKVMDIYFTDTQQFDKIEGDLASELWMYLLENRFVPMV